MNTSISRTDFLRWSSWASLALPLVAYVLCSEFSTSHLIFHAPAWGHNVVLLRHYAFLASAVVGIAILLGDIRFKQWYLLWLPVASLAFTYLLYVEAAWFTGFYD
jgi:hypothetical protein